MQINRQNQHEVKIKSEKVLKTIQNIELNDKIINSLKNGNLPIESLEIVESLKNPKVAKLVIRSLKKGLYAEAKKTRENDPKLEKPKTKDKLFQIEVLKSLLNENLDKINKNEKATENNSQNIFFKSTIKGIKPKLTAFCYDEDVFDEKIYKSMKNNGTINIFHNFLRQKGCNPGDLHPLNHFLEKAGSFYYNEDLMRMEEFSPSPEYLEAEAEEGVLIGKVPLLEDEREKVYSDILPNLASAAKVVVGILTMIAAPNVLSLFGTTKEAVSIGVVYLAV